MSRIKAELLTVGEVVYDSYEGEDVVVRYVSTNGSDICVAQESCDNLRIADIDDLEIPYHPEQVAQDILDYLSKTRAKSTATKVGAIVTMIEAAVESARCRGCD